MRANARDPLNQTAAAFQSEASEGRARKRARPALLGFLIVAPEGHERTVRRTKDPLPSPTGSERTAGGPEHRTREGLLTP